MNDLWVDKHLCHILDRPGRHALRLAHRQKRLSRVLLGRIVQHSGKLVAICQTVCIGRKARVLRQFWHLQQIAQPPILRIIACCDDDMAVGAVEHLIGHQIRMGVARPRRGGAGRQIIHRLIGHHRNSDIVKRQINVLTYACGLPLVNSR